jgi:hypothetical protein
MSEKTEEQQAQTRFEQCVRDRKADGLNIDAEAAEIAAFYMPMYDPYGLLSGLPNGWPQELEHVVKTLFARTPPSNWVRFEDLPDATVRVLKNKIHDGVYNGPETSPFDEFNEVAEALKAAKSAIEGLEKALADLEKLGRWFRFFPTTNHELSHDNGQ